MPLTYNGTWITNVIYNGVNVSTIKLNGNYVFTKGLSKIDNVTPLSVSMAPLGITVGNYAIFAGLGNVVNVYNSSLSRIDTGLSWSNVDNSGAVTRIGNYAIFVCGDTTVAVNDSFTKISLSSIDYKPIYLAASTVGDYAIFAYGKGINHYKAHNSSVFYATAYNSSLTSTSCSALVIFDNDKYDLASTTVGNYAIFAGGYRQYKHPDATNAGYVGSLNTVDAVNGSLTYSKVAPLTNKKHRLAATTVGNYALFAGGKTTIEDASVFHEDVEVYDSSLVKTTATDLYCVRGWYMYDMAATTVGKYAIFAGGHCPGDLQIYDTSLTRNDEFPHEMGLSVAAYCLGATTLGNYALFAGGTRVSSPYGPTDTVNVYRYHE